LKLLFTAATRFNVPRLGPPDARAFSKADAQALASPIRSAFSE
jgi:hypothetical protein